MNVLKSDIVPAATMYDSTYSSYTVVGPANVDVGLYESLTLFVAVHQTPTGTDPTLEVMLQHSPNGTNMWAPLAAIPRIEVPVVDADDGPGGWPRVFAVSVPGATGIGASTFGPYVRVVLRTGGTVPQYTVSISLTGRGA